MIPYASTDYYIDVFQGVFDGEDNDLNKLLIQASRHIDRITFNRIVKSGIDNLTPFQHDLVQEATCRQADYINSYAYSSGGVSSFSVNGVSVSTENSTSIAEKHNFDKEAFNLISQTGLTWTGVF